MAYENTRMVMTDKALEDLDSAQYHAIALDDGKLGTTGEEAAGIILNKPKNGESVTIGYTGVLKFAAGGAITKGGKITVAGSGWFTAGDSGDYIVGEAKETVTSGSNGTGIFNFPNAPYLSV